jgi:acetyl esterase/lipase/acylphosphatase
MIKLNRIKTRRSRHYFFLNPYGDSSFIECLKLGDYIYVCVIFALTITGISILFAQSSPSGDSNQPILPNWQNLTYAKSGDQEKLDIFLPNQGKGPFPVIMYIHGGAWMSGSKTAGSAAAGLKKGYAIVAVVYTLSQEEKFPKQIFEIKAAIRWVRANAKEYKLNPDKIAIWGDSAGGHLAALAGVSGDVNDLDDLTMGNPRQSSRVQAVVDWYGPTDFLTIDRQRKEAGITNPLVSDPNTSPETQLLGSPAAKVPELAKKVSPANFISPDDPPIFIQHGKVDTIVPYQQSVDFEAKLVKFLGREKVTLELIEGAGHGGAAFNTAENIDKIFKFLDRYLKNDDPNRTVARHVIFTGKVQGVGFRNRTLTIAGRYPVTGFVQNLADGTVEMLAQGKAKDIDNFIRDIQNAFSSNIKEIKIDQAEYNGKYKDFQITYLP